MLCVESNVFCSTIKYKSDYSDETPGSGKIRRGETMNKLKYWFLTVALMLSGVSVYSTTSAADEIVRKVDAFHMYGADFEMSIRVESYLNQHLKGTTVMRVYVNDGQITMLTFVEPEKYKNRKILIKNNDIQVVIPKVKNPVKVTASQKLMGGISYGDVSRICFSKDYTAKLLGEERVSGMNDAGNQFDAGKCLLLELTAKDPQKSYNKINIWVDKTDFTPVKADFYALSGKKMTTVYYAGLKEWGGKTVLTKMFLFDRINSAKHYSLTYYDIEATSDKIN
jgi:outer membrane lipoprotein-sorting protein